jgi:hypothetical protein
VIASVPLDSRDALLLVMSTVTGIGFCGPPPRAMMAWAGVTLRESEGTTVSSRIAKPSGSVASLRWTGPVTSTMV